ncbi:MAG: Zn-ribbon domain-containing OB-fold protein [Actinomycetota bacterium]
MASPAWHLPEPDPETTPYWEAAGEGRLLIKECRACGALFFYPRTHCPRCWSSDTEWREASGRGSVYTFTVVHQNDLPPFRDRVPYVVALIELEEGVRMTSNVEGCPPEQVACGMPVRVAFREEAGEGRTVTVPVFRPA